MITKPTTGGEVLLIKKGPKYFSKLAKQGWIKRKAQRKLWEKLDKKTKELNQKNIVKSVKKSK